MPLTPIVVGTPGSACGLVDRTVQNVSVIVVGDCAMIVEPGAAVSCLRLSQSLPTPKIHELAFVVVIVSDGSPASPVALLAIAVAAPASVFCAPVNPTTVICATCDWLNTPTTVIGDVRAACEKAYQI